ncbi:MAG TPA: ribonuclease P protein component [Candidatus Dormibacteraeota bacterium]|jgi:ribonuclease P protein component|nr:ribonuclease P protein component [Candidatus Dormibacteraeota bacterium]
MSILPAGPAVNETSKKVSQGFPRDARLLKHADFQVVYKQGRKHFSGNMMAFYRERENTAGPRVGFTVGKVLGGAVDRNRIRRRMRAAVRNHLRELARPLDLVLHPRKSVLTLKFGQLDAEIMQVFAAVQRGRGR